MKLNKIQQSKSFVDLNLNQNKSIRPIQNIVQKQKQKLKKGQLIFQSTDFYPLLNQFQIQQSRFNSFQEYQYLLNQIKNFNCQLKLYKDNKGTIKNIRCTYYLYVNLHARIRQVNNLSNNQQSANKSINNVLQWFQNQKPKIRGQMPKDPQPQIKPFQQDYFQKRFISDLTQASMRKRQMLPYQKMSRTTHTGFFPPKERLLDYRKKQFVLNHKLTIDNEQLNSQRQKRLAMSASQSQRISSKRPSLRTTMTTLQGTKTSFNMKNNQNKMISTTGNFASSRDQVHQLKINQQFDVDINQFDLENLNGQNKNLQQQQMVKDVIQQPKYQQDAAQNQQQDILEEQNQTPQKYKKAFIYQHPRSSKQQAAIQTIKDENQSTLRRLLIMKEKQIHNKLEDLNIKENILKWAKTKSFINQQIDRKSQSYKKINDFHRTQFKKKNGFFEKRKQIQEFDFIVSRSKTSQGREKIEKQVQQKKIIEAMRMFGRYISTHVKVQKNNDIDNIENQNQIKMMRATSLTCFNRKNKKKQFGQILASNNFEIYNEQAADNTIYLKEKLAKKSINMNKNATFSALSAVNTQRYSQMNVFPKSSGLLSNPFFPKHLYETKKKKKK